MKKVVPAVVVIAVLIFLISKCSSGTYTPGPVKAGGDTVTVAIEYSPSGIFLSGDTLSGIGYEYARRLFSKNNIPAKIIPAPGFDKALDMLRNGEIDIYIPDAPSVTKLKTEFIFTDPVEKDRQVLVYSVSSGDSVSGVLDRIVADTVCVPAKSPFSERLKHLSREIGSDIIVREIPDAGSETLLLSVAAGDLRQVVVNRNIAEEMVKKHPELRIAGEISFSQFQSWLLKPENSALRDSINSWMKKM